MKAVPDEVRERLIAIADNGEWVWQQVAVIVLDLLEQPGAQKMRIYADVGACLGMKSAGVRSWVGTYQAVGDDLLAEFPQFRYTHWRILVAAANKQHKSLAELAMEWAATADAHSGLPVPPDALAAKLGQPKDERHPLVKGLERAGAALASAERHVPPNQTAFLERLEWTEGMVADLAAEAARILKPEVVVEKKES